MKSTTRHTPFVLALCLSASVAASAQGAGRQAAGSQQGGQQSAAQKYFTDVELVDQDGKTRRLYTDLLKGKTVVIDSIFTDDSATSPPMTATLKKVQDELGERFGRDVFFVTLTVDPETDTPERLKEYAAKFKVKPGWLFLTGKKDNVELALHKLGMYVEDKSEHTAILVVGNEATGLWKKTYGLAPLSQILQVVKSVADDKGDAAKQD